MAGRRIPTLPYQSLGQWAFDSVITAEVQIHGYRKGHQLLASSISLSKDDQAVVDRLSDVAGPLRPKEQFAPYLSAYPLPSGTYYVVARTWQDHSVPRAGCVRTKSVLIDARAWSLKPPLTSILRQLSSSELPTEMSAVHIELDEQLEEELPPTLAFSAGELLEALFLEDAKPVVVFDAPDPELIAVRLLTALWPDMRRRFSLSTFALSPRKIAGRDLDLVFAPSNAKSKFSDWSGRRVDGRSSQIDRHRWTGAITRRVFAEPIPRLMSDREINLLGDRDTDSAAALRIALLWEELLDKLHQSPTALLGLFDIANSGMVRNATALRMLEPRVAEAARLAVSMPSNHAWDFVSAITRKMQGHSMPDGSDAVKQLAKQLAEHAPEGAINLLEQPDPKGCNDGLISSIAMGLSNGAAPQVEQLLVGATSNVIARLISQGGTLTNRVTEDTDLIKRMGAVLNEVAPDLADKAGMMMLPLLTEDRHLPAAMPIFKRLDSQGVAKELDWLGEKNGLQAKQLSTCLIKRAREVRGLPAVRSVLLSWGPSAQRDSLLAQTIDPICKDVQWLLDEKRLSHKTSTSLLVNLLKRASDIQLSELMSDGAVAERVIAQLPESAVNILERVTLPDDLPINVFVSLIKILLSKVEDNCKSGIAKRALNRCLRTRFEGDETELLVNLLDIAGTQLDGKWVARSGLERSIDSDIASRNLIVFDIAHSPARLRIVQAADEIVRTLEERYSCDLTEAANDACARLILDSEKTAFRPPLIEAAGRLMPMLLSSRRKPVSQMIAALFPIVYRELARTDEGPNILSFLPFFDWDRCKNARHGLVDAFMSSNWTPGDLALTAYRCGDVGKILGRVAKLRGGKEYLSQVENDLGHLNDDAQRFVSRTIDELHLHRL